MNGKAPDMKLVNHQVLHGNQRPGHVAPVEVVLDHPGLVMLVHGGLNPPLALARHRPGVGVQQVFRLIENNAPGGVSGTVYPEGILELLDVQLEHDHGVHISDAVTLREGENGVRLRLLPPEEQKLNGGGPVGVNREVYAAGDGGGSVDLVKARAHVEAVDMVHGDQVNGAGQGHRGGGLLGKRCLGRDVVLCFHRKLLPRRSGDCRIRLHYTTFPQICHNFFPFL